MSQIELHDSRTGELLQILEVPNLDGELEIFALEYFDEQTKKWKLSYTCDKSEYDKYIEWSKCPELSPEQEKARYQLWEKLMKK
jgi:hypothetical protein